MKLIKRKAWYWEGLGAYSKMKSGPYESIQAAQQAANKGEVMIPPALRRLILVRE